jgi:hypothetical protein
VTSGAHWFLNPAKISLQHFRNDRSVLPLSRHNRTKRKGSMKKLLLIAAAVAAVIFAAPASAQVNIRAGESGVKVRVGGPGPHVHRHHRVHRHHHVRGHFARGHCRSVTSRTVTPGGRVIVKTRRVCR